MLSTVLFLAVALVAVFYFISIYNRLVRLKHYVSNAWSNIDVAPKQRHDELPKMVDVCRQYMRYEQETLQKVIKARGDVAPARQRGDVNALGPAESALRKGLANLFALAEAYPDLKANNTFKHLQSRISGLENSIADRREFYNESVNRNNIAIEQFPDTLIARSFHFAPHPLQEFSEEERRDVNVAALFG